MKVIDERGKLFGKINVIDFGVLCLLVLLALAAYIKFGVLNQTNVEAVQESVTYLVQVNNVRDYFVENIREGDTLYDLDGYDEIGTISHISYEAYKTTLTRFDGTIIETALPERYTVFIEVAAESRVTEGRYFVNGTYEINVGSSRTFNTKYAQIYGMIREIRSDG